MSVRLDQDITNLTANLAVKTGEETIKVTGKLALEMLMLLANKLKEREENKIGLMALKKLQKSGEELQIIKLEESHLEKFNELAKKYRIPFAAITQDGQSRVFIKSSSVPLATEIMKEILKDTKENKIKNVDIDKLNFKEVGEEKEYIRCLFNGDLEKSRLINKIFKAQSIKAEMLVDDYDEKTGEGNIFFKVKNEDAEKIEEALEIAKGSTIEELNEELKALEIKKSKDEVIKNSDIVKRKKLDEVIEEAKDVVDKECNEVSNSKERNKHKKDRSQHEER